MGTLMRINERIVLKHELNVQRSEFSEYDTMVWRKRKIAYVVESHSCCISKRHH